MTSATRSLSELQRAFRELCFKERVDVSATEMDTLQGDPKRWLVYRRMVRGRLAEMIHNGLPKTHQLLAERAPDRLAADVSAFLAERAPSSRFLREVVGEFAEFLEEGWRGDESLPPHAADLLRYEATRWEVRSLPEAPLEVADFDFERGRCAINPVLRTHSMSYRVDKDPMSPAALAEPHLMLLYRRPGESQVRGWVLNRIGGLLFVAWSREQTASDAVRQVLSDIGGEPDAGFIDSMASVLTNLLNNRIILGSWAPDRMRSPAD